MRKKLQLYSSLLRMLTILFLLPACEKEDNETLISRNGQNESHQEGDNCMQCHTSGGKGEGWFIAAGTVYTSNLQSTLPNGEILFYTGPNGTGTLVKTIEVDQLGNFFTTEDIDFSKGLYTAAKGSETTIYMDGPITSGQCNSCHGQSTEKIYTH